MIKCEVVFDGDKIIVNGIEVDVDSFGSCALRQYFETIEQAVKHCMEQSNV